MSKKDQNKEGEKKRKIHLVNITINTYTDTNTTGEFGSVCKPGVK